MIKSSRWSCLGVISLLSSFEMTYDSNNAAVYITSLLM